MSIEKAIEVVKTIRSRGQEAYFIGGFTRDYLLKKNHGVNIEPHDFDIVTSMCPADVRLAFPKVLTVGAAFGVSIVMMGDTPIEVATFRADGDYLDHRHPNDIEIMVNLEEDTERRDFTINAMAYDPITGHILDFHEGEKDLERRVIRAVGNPEKRIKEDALRMLRAVRLKAQLEFSIDGKLEEAIQANAHLIRNLSAERIRDELFKICATRSPEIGLCALADLGLMKFVIPEAMEMIGCKQDPIWHPEGDVWTHAIQVVTTLSQMNANPLLILAGFLHDIGKPSCSQSCMQNGIERISNLGHAEKGAEIAGKVAYNLRMSEHDSSKLIALVANHMRAHEGEKMRRSTLIKFMRELDNKDILYDQILLQHADGFENGKSLYDFYRTNLDKVELGEIKINPTKLLTGDDLIKIFNLSPSPLFKTILEHLSEAQDEGVIRNKEEAISLVESKFMGVRG